MIYSVSHITLYDFSGPVFLEPHILRLFPRCDGIQNMIGRDLRIIPDPAGISRGLDIWGNPFALVWFDGLHSSLRIDNFMSIETLRDNPFDYYLPEQSRTLPVSLEPHERAPLVTSLERMSISSENADSISRMRDQFLKSSQGDTISFLAALNSWIFENFQRTERTEPGIIDPLRLIKIRQGSCRDLAVLFIEICRAAGIPARFVSGYQEGDPEVPQAELHAWVEVYLPGAGWRGYDPTHGLAVADRHVTLAAAPDPQQTMPVSGTFRATGVTSIIEHRVRMEAAGRP